jgi:hypothetical protein
MTKLSLEKLRDTHHGEYSIVSYNEKKKPLPFLTTDYQWSQFSIAK